MITLKMSSIAMFWNFNAQPNPLRAILKLRLLGPISGLSDSRSLGLVWKFTFLTGFQVLLLVWGLHFESHWFGDSNSASGIRWASSSSLKRPFLSLRPHSQSRAGWCPNAHRVKGGTVTPWSHPHCWENSELSASVSPHTMSCWHIT